MTAEPNGASSQVEYIVASIGRSGSTLLTRLIEGATGSCEAYVQDLWAADLPLGDGTVKKTHAHFRAEPHYPYRAVYAWGDVGDAVASLYSGRAKNLPAHLEHLEVDLEDRIRFWELLDELGDVAFEYLVRDDRLRLWDNIGSWAGSEHTIYVEYERLCAHKDEVLGNLRSFLDLDLPDFDVRPRRADRSLLPEYLQAAVDDVYGGFGPPEGVLRA